MTRAGWAGRRAHLRFLDLAFRSRNRDRNLIDIARGSALESAAALEVLVAKKRCAQEEDAAGKDQLWSIVSMLAGWIRLNSDHRLREGSLE